MTPDSVTDGEYSVAGWNRYMYCAGNPVRYKDPSGHDADENVVALTTDPVALIAYAIMTDDHKNSGNAKLEFARGVGDAVTGSVLGMVSLAILSNPGDLEHKQKVGKTVEKAYVEESQKYLKLGQDRYISKKVKEKVKEIAENPYRFAGNVAGEIAIDVTTAGVGNAIKGAKFAKGAFSPKEANMKLSDLVSHTYGAEGLHGNKTGNVAKYISGIADNINPALSKKNPIALSFKNMDGKLVGHVEAGQHRVLAAMKKYGKHAKVNDIPKSMIIKKDPDISFDFLVPNCPNMGDIFKELFSK